MSPTEYTAAITEGDGISFNAFAMRCARAFGALVQMRDMPMDAPIPEKFEQSSYHAEQITDDETTLSELIAMPEGDIADACQKEYDEGMVYYTERLDSIAAQKLKYASMLNEVEAWVPPTSDHEELKSFMRNQIQESIDHDCSTTYTEPPKKVMPGDWHAQKIDTITRSIEYHKKHHTDDVSRAATRTEWVRQLRNSLSA